MVDLYRDRACIDICYDMMKYQELTMMLYGVYETLLYVVDSEFVKNGHLPIIDDDFVESMMRTLQSKYYLIISPYFIKTLFTYYVEMNSNISFMHKTCKCYNNVCGCVEVINKFC